MKKQTLMALVTGMVLGGGAGATLTSAWAGPGATAGWWHCYRQGKFPDAAAAANTDLAKDMTVLMNHVASKSPTGSLVVFPAGQNLDYNVLCSKN